MKSTIQYQSWGINPGKKNYRINNIFFGDYGMVHIGYQIGNETNEIKLSVHALEEGGVLNFENLLPYIDGK